MEIDPDTLILTNLTSESLKTIKNESISKMTDVFPLQSHYVTIMQFFQLWSCVADTKHQIPEIKDQIPVS